MGKQFTELSKEHIKFIEAQKIYFIGTAAENGKVNISPKGGDSLRVLNTKTVAWLNLTGSGNETSAHVLKNPRMTIMFSAFEGKPLILRLYGSAKVLHITDVEWKSYISLFPESVASRQIFLLEIDLIQSSCGMSVPLFEYKADRNELAEWSKKQGKEGIEKYWVNKNQTSLDGFETEIVKRNDIGKSQ